MIHTLVGAVLLLGASSDIHWERSLEAALARAKTENKPVFVAVNMDGEKANDRLVATVYRNAKVRALSERTVNLIASRDDHGSSCKRFGGIACADHQKVEQAVRARYLKPNKQGFIIVPQHLFLDPQGEVLLSVPYLISAEELRWCLHTALNKVDPSHAIPGDPSLRPPSRLVMQGVEPPASGDEGDGVVPTRDKVLELINSAKRLQGGDRRKILWNVITADEEEAREFVEREMKTKAMGKGYARQRCKVLHRIGVLSPPSYWKLVSAYADDAIPNVRSEVAVALEQLAAPESLRLVIGALKKEKDPVVKRNWIRALGSVGAADRSARKLLVKEAQSGKMGLQVDAILALGRCDQEKEVVQQLCACLEHADPAVRAATACSMAITRRAEYRALLEELQAKESDEAALQAVQHALEVYDGENLRRVQPDVRALTGEKIRRERLFGLVR